MTEGDEDISDRLNLSGPLTVEAVLRTLQERFMDGQCYTWVGSVLLFINAFETPSTAAQSVLQKLAKMLVDDAPDGRDRRSLIFSGVGGSGKTFTADRLLMKLFTITKKSDWFQDLRKNWQVSCVVLKALGSAATESNRDSSRMGRMVDFHFSGKQIVKVKINCYFLDQMRLVSPPINEQSFHIFYQILAGLTSEERAKFQCSDHDHRTLHYLSQGTEPRESTQQLQSHFEAWKSSLAQLGIPLTDVLKVLVAVMLLGNIVFYEAKNQELAVQNANELQNVASLLGVQASSLQRGLTLRTYTSSRGIVQSACSAAASNGARDSLAKTLYIRTVVAIMRKINTLLKGPSHRSHSGPLSSAKSFSPLPLAEQNDQVVHILDLFGFEQNEVNALEQLCINWSDEKIEHFYVQSMFRDMLERCRTEEVDPMWEGSPHDCFPCIQLIGDENKGMVEMLNQETLSPRVSSEDIRVRLKEQFGSSPCFIPPSGSSSTFAIRHYCGEVVYDIYNLLNANADTIADDVIATFNSKDCKFGFVAHLFVGDLIDGTPKGQMGRIIPSYLQHASHAEQRQMTAYIQDFQSNFNDVLETLKKSQPFFVRCLKSNSSQVVGYFDSKVVSTQIQNLAIFETVDYVQGGFTHSLTHESFVRKFSMVCSNVSAPPLTGTPKEVVQDLLRAFVVTQGGDGDDCTYAVGRTLVFVSEEMWRSLCGERERRQGKAAILLQSYVRMYLCRKHWPELKVSLRHSQLQSALLTHGSTTTAGTQPSLRADEYTPRNYTVYKNFKINFPQWRVMKYQYPDNGASVVLRPGDEVYVISRSHRRGYLVVELFSGGNVHVPHNYTELRLTPPNSPSLTTPAQRQDPVCSDL